jgi:hypothetical protein
MAFLRECGAQHLVVFALSRAAASGEVAGEMGLRAGLHNRLGPMVQVEAEVDQCIELTDARLFRYSPEAHLQLAGTDAAKPLARYQRRPMLAGYKDARCGEVADTDFRPAIFDLGDGETGFAAC